MKDTRVMVCVTKQRNCERLIHMGRMLAQREQHKLSVVNVELPGANFLGSADEGEALEYLFQVSSAYQADMTVLKDDDVVETLIRYAKENGVCKIVIGRALAPESEHSIVSRLKKELRDVEVYVS
jgi:K+-sensing histidine kinase KdpD